MKAARTTSPSIPASFVRQSLLPLPPLGDQITVNWRYRVPEDVELTFRDECLGEQRSKVGRDFGDFLVWSKDDTPSYQLATVVDESELGITEVVRGADLVKSTFRQSLLFTALGWQAPRYYHAPLLLDERGQRLAKRHDALSLRTPRERGLSPEDVRKLFDHEGRG
jgi:glutamyl-tRNA synthetase